MTVSRNSSTLSVFHLSMARVSATSSSSSSNYNTNLIINGCRSWFD